MPRYTAACMMVGMAGLLVFHRELSGDRHDLWLHRSRCSKDGFRLLQAGCAEPQPSSRQSRADACRLCAGQLEHPAPKPWPQRQVEREPEGPELPIRRYESRHRGPGKIARVGDRFAGEKRQIMRLGAPGHGRRLHVHRLRAVGRRQLGFLSAIRHPSENSRARPRPLRCRCGSRHRHR